jgi:hypothetical protein
MKRALIGLLSMLIAAWYSGAQQVGSEDRDVEGNVVRSFSENLAAQANLFNLYSASDTSARGGKKESETPQRLCPEGVPADVLPPCRWQLGVGVEFLRFRSDLFSSSVAGLHTSLTYFTNDWYGLEGNIATGIGPTIYDHEHVKYFAYQVGIHVGSRSSRWVPWGHLLVGGAHLLPQTAGNNQNAFQLTAGGGWDYRVHALISLRTEVDYVFTHFFEETQNNFQGTVGIVIHF